MRAPVADSALSGTVVEALSRCVGTEWTRSDSPSRDAYGVDALGIGCRPDLVVLPGTAGEVASVVRVCAEHRVPVVARGAGTGYTGGAVPLLGGVVLALDRLNRIREIDETNLIAIVEPNVVTASLQAAVERVGLFYPPDPASLDVCSIGGNVAENAGGPRAFKYGTTRRYVLGLEAVLADGTLVRTGSKAVKNVVGYDLTQLLVGSEGTLAIITAVTLRLIPLPPTRATVLASFSRAIEAVEGVSVLLRKRVVPAAIEFMDEPSLRAVERHTGESLTSPGTSAVLLIELDGTPGGVEDERTLVADACREAGATTVAWAANEDERTCLWSIRRQLSPALKSTGLRKINHDVVVPRGRIPQLLEGVAVLAHEHRLVAACFGHAGDGNIHVNFLIPPDDAAAATRAETAERQLFEQVVALEGSISGEHGIGFSKAPFLGIELSDDVIGVMQRVKTAFDPHGILNPGKIFPAAHVGRLGEGASRRVDSGD